MWRFEFLDRKVFKEFVALSDDLQADYFRIIETIQSKGPLNVGMPLVRPLGRKLWEVRMHGKDGIARAMYVTAKERRLVVVHVFTKKTQATPERALTLALKRAKEAGLL